MSVSLFNPLEVTVFSQKMFGIFVRANDQNSEFSIFLSLSRYYM